MIVGRDVSLAVSGVVEAGVGVHGRDRLMVVHRIRTVAQSQFAEFLRENSLAALKDFSALSLPVPVFDPSPL